MNSGSGASEERRRKEGVDQVINALQGDFKTMLRHLSSLCLVRQLAQQVS